MHLWLVTACSTMKNQTLRSHDHAQTIACGGMCSAATLRIQVYTHMFYVWKAFAQGILKSLSLYNDGILRKISTSSFSHTIFLSSDQEIKCNELTSALNHHDMDKANNDYTNPQHHQTNKCQYQSKTRC